MSKKVLLTVLVFLLVPFLVLAEEKDENSSLAENAKSAIMIEASTGEIIYQKNIHEKLAPASMTKIMSMLLIMEAIDSGKITLNDKIYISENAAKMGGSQIFLSIGSQMKVKELLKGIAVASGNDAVVAMAEKIGGSESNFVKLMNKRCQELGCLNTNFKNAHGLDDADHYSSAYDMSLMARELIKHEKILEFTSIYEEYLNKPDGTSTWLVNTNRLVRFYEGMDGLKTGFTNEAGYCLTATAKRGNLRFITVVMNEPSSDKRSSDTMKLMNYGFNAYQINIILSKNAEIGKIKIDNAKEENINLALISDVTELKKIIDENKKWTFEVQTKKVKAPLKVGDVVGTLKLLVNKKVMREVPITVQKDVKKANFFDIVQHNFKIYLSGIKLF